MTAKYALEKFERLFGKENTNEKVSYAIERYPEAMAFVEEIWHLLLQIAADGDGQSRWFKERADKINRCLKYIHNTYHHLPLESE